MSERLQKILARGGLASRRRAEEMITSGRVRVNGHVVKELGAKADPYKDRIDVDGTRLIAEQLVYFLFHKPRGIVSTMSDPEGRPTVKESFAQISARVFPVGRLDFATSGALIVTNDGEFMNGLLHPKTDVPKTYILKVKGKMTPADIEKWRTGIELEDGITKPAEVKFDRFEEDKTWLYVTLTEGRNQQIRRMGEASGFRVMRLSRVAFAGISTEGLKPGALRPLSREELMDLRKKYGVPRKLPAPAVILDYRPRDTHAKTAPSARRSTRSSDNRPKGPNTHGANRTSGARYGGGSPGRRSPDVTEDWGGGAGRGRSQSADTRGDQGSSQGSRGNTNPNANAGGRGQSAPRGELGGGRFGRTRTTGTSGGVATNNDADRVKGRRR